MERGMGMDGMQGGSTAGGRNGGDGSKEEKLRVWARQARPEDEQKT